MRKIVNLKNQKNEIKRLMIYNENDETYLFGFKTLTDSNADWDEFYESESDAMETCKTEYGVDQSEWKEIPNPQKYCQHDWINPVRIKGRENGKPEFGKFERLVDGKWLEFEVLNKNNGS